MTKSERWILSEWWVARDLTQRLGCELIAHREKTPYAEVDLVVRRQFLTIVEVKTVTPKMAAHLWAGLVITPRQVARLEKARWYLELKHQRPVKLVLAVVNSSLGPVQNRIRYFEAPFS